MPETSTRADVSSPFGGGQIVIIGAGIVGLSIAYHLTLAGHSKVVVLDRGRIAGGTTASGTGGIRQQFTSRINASLVHASIPEFVNFTESVGEPFEFRQHGYLFLFTKEQQMVDFTAAVAMQNEIGIPSKILSPSSIAELAPHVNLEDVRGGSYCATDGSAIATEAALGWANAARRAGADIREGLEVVGFLRARDGSVRGVTTAEGTVMADRVIIATGSAARKTGLLAGIELDVDPHPRQAFAVDSVPWLPAERPLTVDLDSGAYLHPKGNGSAIIGGNDRATPAGTDTTVRWELTPELLRALAHRFPSTAGIEIARGWSGLREMTPDDHALVGQTQVENLWVAAGFSGHGFMQSPAIGRAIAETTLFGHSDIDLTPLRPSRFRENAAIVESVLF